MSEFLVASIGNQLWRFKQKSVHFVWVRALNIALDSLGKLESQACQPTTQPKEPTQAHGEIPQAGPGLGPASETNRALGGAPTTMVLPRLQLSFLC